MDLMKRMNNVLKENKEKKENDMKFNRYIKENFIEIDIKIFDKLLYFLESKGLKNFLNNIIEILQTHVDLSFKTTDDNIEKSNYEETIRALSKIMFRL